MAKRIFLAKRNYLRAN